MCACVHAYEQKETDAFQHVHRMCRQTHTGTLKRTNANAFESFFMGYIYVYM